MMATDEAGRSQLHYAALNDDVSSITRLVADGAPVNAQDEQGFTPLHLACQQGARKAAEALLAAGADVDVTNTFGNTPLFVAVYHSRGSGSLIQLLRQHGANPVVRNNAGQTPVGLARLIGNFDVAQYFADLPAERD
jgi:uncharacterized protein